MKGFKRLFLNLLLFPMLLTGAAGGGSVAAAEDTDFDSFFAEAAAGGEDDSKPAGGSEGTEGSEGTDEAARLAAEKEEAEKAAAEKAAAEKAATEKAEAEKADAEKADRERIDAQAREAVDRAAAEKAAKEQQERSNQPSAEEIARLAEEKAKDVQFRKEWPDHARMMDKQKADLEALQQSFQTALAQINGLTTTTQQELAQKHEAAILGSHPDAYDLVPEIEKWIAAQPSYLQPAYQNVLTNGSPAEVIGFLDTFKAATGKLTPAADDAAKKAEEERLKAEKDKADAERKKALHLAPVTTRRSNVVGSLDDADFDGAFAEASKEFNKKVA